MWLLAGVQLLRALRMSHRLTFFTSPLALAVSLFGFVRCVLVVFVFGVWFPCFLGVPVTWNTIVHTNTFSLFSSGRPLTLDRDLLCAMVAFDDSRRRYRFTLGEAPDSNRKPSLVIAASSLLPSETFNESYPQTGPRQVLPSTLPRPALPKFGVYFCQVKIFRGVLLRDGIKPTQRTANPPRDGIALKLHATNSGDISEGVLKSRLNRNNRPICLFVHIPATFDAGFSWTSIDDSVIGTSRVPLPPSFFHRAIDISHQLNVGSRLYPHQTHSHSGMTFLPPLPLQWISQNRELTLKRMPGSTKSLKAPLHNLKQWRNRISLTWRMTNLTNMIRAWTRPLPIYSKSSISKRTPPLHLSQLNSTQLFPTCLILIPGPA